MYTLYSDGGARGNPGPAGIGAVLLDENQQIIGEYSEYIGKTTNNQAEYKALILGLENALKQDVNEITCYLDSELVVKQLNREYKVKDAQMSMLFIKVWNLVQKFTTVSFKHVRREKNKHADKLVNEALDKQLGKKK